MADIPPASIARFPIYLRCLEEIGDTKPIISSVELAEAASVHPAQLRRDLLNLGAQGIRGVGYETRALQERLARALGLGRRSAAVIVGAGNLGRAIAQYEGLERSGYRLVGVFDSDPLKIGSRVGTHMVEPSSDLETAVHHRAVTVAIIATPPNAALEVARRLARAGVKSILNLAPAVLDVPPEVLVRRVDLASELQILKYYETQASS